MGIFKFSKLEQFLASSIGKRLMNLLYSWGAAVVIIGALFKILHLTGGNTMLIIGMITEAFVFFVSAFDNAPPATQESEENLPITTGQTVIVGNSSSAVQTTGSSLSGSAKMSGEAVTGSSISKPAGGGSGASSTIIIGGGNSNQSFPRVQMPKTSKLQPFVEEQLSSGIIADENKDKRELQESYTKIVSNKPSEFSEQTTNEINELAESMNSLSSVSSILLDSYQKMAENSKGISEDSEIFSKNIKTLNQNIINLNNVFESQMGSVLDQMSAVKYINESLERIKNQYGSAILDSSLFKEESEKMTRQIMELNGIYYRLIQAMRANNSGY